MNVIFDISTVGDNAKARTGLARVAWTLANLLHRELGDDLSFSAIGSIDASLQIENLLRSCPNFRSAAEPVNSIAKKIDLLNKQISKDLDRSQSNIITKAQQLTLSNVSRFFNITRQPIDPQALATADLFHSTYPRIPKQVRAALPNRHLQTVYDLTPLLLDEKYFHPGQRGITQRLIDTIQPDDWVTTISNATRNDLLDRRQLNPDRVITTYLAAAPDIFYQITDKTEIATVRQKYQLPPGDYFLSLHSLGLHKNMEHLIACFKQVIAQEKMKDLHLVICGGNKNSVASSIESNHLTETDLNNIHFTGFIADEDLAAIYSGALGFIFPSLYEGFGLPVLEAMQCGCPVISSNTSSLPEVVGESGFLVSPLDRDALCEAMLKLYHDSDLCAQYARLSLERSTLFSWEKTVNETIDIYKKILHDPSS